jgi:hypothetical protein
MYGSSCATMGNTSCNKCLYYPSSYEFIMALVCVVGPSHFIVLHWKRFATKVLLGYAFSKVCSNGTCTYQHFNQLSTLLCCDKICETLLLTYSISNLFQHSNFEMHFFSSCFTFQDLSKIYSLICTILYKILNDLWKKNFLKLNYVHKFNIYFAFKIYNCVYM